MIDREATRWGTGSGGRGEQDARQILKRQKKRKKIVCSDQQRGVDESIDDQSKFTITPCADPRR